MYEPKTTITDRLKLVAMIDNDAPHLSEAILAVMHDLTSAEVLLARATCAHSNTRLIEGSRHCMNCGRIVHGGSPESVSVVFGGETLAMHPIPEEDGELQRCACCGRVVEDKSSGAIWSCEACAVPPASKEPRRDVAGNVVCALCGRATVLTEIKGTYLCDECRS